MRLVLANCLGKLEEKACPFIDGTNGWKKSLMSSEMLLKNKQNKI